MKYLLLSILLYCLGLNAFSQQGNSIIGTKAPEITFDNLYNARVSASKLSEIKNKIVIIEFWATWCAPCIRSLGQLEKLQTKYKNKVQVVAVNTFEAPEKVKKFLQGRKSILWYLTDTSQKIKNTFPHGIIPHTVVIDADKIIRASTLPGFITDSVIDRLLKKQEIVLPVKNDLLEATLEDIFNPGPDTEESFTPQPYIAGFYGSTTIEGAGIFKGRRISFINCYLPVIYKFAYKWPGSRFKDNTKPDAQEFKPEDSYCLDVIVPEGFNKEERLRKYMQQNLANIFDVKVRFEKKKMKVAVISASDSALIKLTTSSKPYKNNGMRRNSYSVDGATMKNFIDDYLDEWQIFGMPCIDETGISGKFDFKFEYILNVKGALSEALNKMGLILTIEEREVEIMILEK
ncbi:MAG: redoxin domain-containing protein [Ferruginibacter sp.]